MKLLQAVLGGVAASWFVLAAAAAEPSSGGVNAAVGGAGAAAAAELQSSHAQSIAVSGHVLRYTASAGTLMTYDDQNHPAAQMFYVAYVGARAPGGAERPVTFLYNGGPGSASLWLNIGGFGPWRVPASAPRSLGGPPYTLVANEATLLDKTDLVFIDAVGTGYSHAVTGREDHQFWGVDADVDTYARAIIRYLEKNHRWQAPKFLFGESYGTTRSGALAYQLHAHDVDVNGVILLSPILNYSDTKPGLDLNDILIMPSYAAAAWYFHKGAFGDLSLDGLLDKARQFAFETYARALQQGGNLSAQQRRETAHELSQFIGLAPEYLEAADLRIDLERYRRQLLKPEGLITGRFDARFSAASPDTSGHYDPATDDPATASVTSAYLAGFRTSLLEQTGFETQQPYKALYNAVIEPAWDWHHKAPGIDRISSSPDTALDLAAAMQANPTMQILVLGGVFDLSTPFSTVDYDLSQLHLPPALRRNITRRLYETGHMAYTDPAALRKMKADLDQFYDSTPGTHR